MGKKDIDWEHIGFNYIQTDKRYVSNFKDGAWDEGGLTSDTNVVLNMEVKLHYIFVHI